MPNERQILVCSYRRYQMLREHGDTAPPANFAPLARHQWYRWAALSDLVDDLETLDVTIARAHLTDL